MLTKFWEGTGESLSEKWLDLLISPSFMFWGGGLAIIASRYGFNQTWLLIQSLTINEQAAAIIVGFLVLSLSAAIVEQFHYAALRILEGYWPWPFHFIGKPIIAIQKWNFDRIQNRWNELKTEEDNGLLTPDGRKKIAILEKQLHYYPTDQDDFLPTSLGNALRAGEGAPYYKYGLEAVTCWARLWLLLPEETQETLSRSRQSLNSFVNLIVWGMFFLFWAWWWKWAILISVIWILIAYTLAVQAAMLYAELVEAAFDLNRFELYKAVRWSVPQKSGEEEVRIGKQLTEFLWRGTTEKPVKFMHPKDSTLLRSSGNQ